jgi:hypothetical protein
MTLADYTTEELVAELARRNAAPRCRCRRWPTYIGAYDRHGNTWRCHGCRRIPAECRCR